MAVILPVHDRPQHSGDRRAEPVGGGRPVHLAASGRTRELRCQDAERLDRRARRLFLAEPGRPATDVRSGLTKRREQWRLPTLLTVRSHALRLAFHFGPDVEVELDGADANLRWPSGTTDAAARMELPRQLAWSLHRGETDPILGWYSPALGRRVPALSLLGTIGAAPGTPLTTRLQFTESQDFRDDSVFRRPISLGRSNAGADKASTTNEEAR